MHTTLLMSSCTRYGFVTFETEEEADKVKDKVLQWTAAVHVGGGEGGRGAVCFAHVCIFKFHAANMSVVNV